MFSLSGSHVARGLDWPLNAAHKPAFGACLHMRVLHQAGCHRLGLLTMPELVIAHCASSWVVSTCSHTCHWSVRQVARTWLLRSSSANTERAAADKHSHADNTVVVVLPCCTYTRDRCHYWHRPSGVQDVLGNTMGGAAFPCHIMSPARDTQMLVCMRQWHQRHFLADTQPASQPKRRKEHACCPSRGIHSRLCVTACAA
jgi:hypothetical protein